MKLLPEAWETDRLRIAASRLDEAPRLREIYNACCDPVGMWDDSFKRVELEETRGLVEKSIAGHVDAGSVFAMRTLRAKESDAIVGYFHLYHGLPHPEIIFLSMCVIDPAEQRRRFGSEAAASLAREARLLGDYSAIWARVALKNWPALRHWMNAGFRTMLEWRGDFTHSQSAFASLIIGMELNG